MTGGLKKSIILILSVSFILVCIILIFNHKITGILVGNIEDNLIYDAQKDVLLYETKLNSIMNVFQDNLNKADEDIYSDGYLKIIDKTKEKNNFEYISVFSDEGVFVAGDKFDFDKNKIISALNGDKSLCFMNIPNQEQGFAFYVPITDSEGNKFAASGFVNKNNIANIMNEDNNNLHFLNYIVDYNFNIIFNSAAEENIGIVDTMKSNDGIIDKINQVHKVNTDKGTYFVCISPVLNNELFLISIIRQTSIAGFVTEIEELLFWVFGGFVILFIIIFCYVEISDEGNKKKIYQLAYVDSLTDLPNWQKMKINIGEVIEKKEEDYVFIFFDIKNFKVLNELYSYQVGDEFLKFIGKNLKAKNEVYTQVARLENDRFAILIKENDDENIVKELKQLFEDIGNLKNNNYSFQYNCGVARIENDIKTVNQIFDNAKIARNISKKYINTEIVFYSSEIKEELVRKQQLRNYLDEALANDEFEVYLQPKYNSNTDMLEGAEALIRWNYKHSKMLSPAVFIPVFEEDGSIGKIDNFVLNKVCEKINKWKEQNYPLHPISVNVSRVQLNNPNLVDDLVNTVKKYNVDFGLIDLELTESAAFDNMQQLLLVMKDIKNRGFKLSMDDFGTGYSSLSLLKEMPLDILKLDKSFVDGYDEKESDSKNAIMIESIISMARHLNITPLAEGVETFEQKKMLMKAGCVLVQGYYYSKPMPISDYETLLKLEMAS